MDKRIEIISVVERRRHWPADEKLRIMEEALAPGAVIASVADRNGVCAGADRGTCHSVISATGPGCAAHCPPAPSIVEIVLGNGRVVKVDDSIDPWNLGTVEFKAAA
jgi:transposase